MAFERFVLKFWLERGIKNSGKRKKVF